MTHDQDAQVEALAETVHSALAGQLIVSTECRGSSIDVAGVELTDIRLHLADGTVVHLEGQGLHMPGWIDVEVEPVEHPDELARLAAEFVAADRARQVADERWKEAVVAIMHDHADFVPTEGVITEEAMHEAVLVAYEAAGVEPFESLGSVLARRARTRREFPDG